MPATRNIPLMKRPPKNMNKSPLLSNFFSNMSSLFCDTIFLNTLCLRIARPYRLPIRYESISPVNTPTRAMGIKMKGFAMFVEIRKPQSMSETPSGKGNPRPPKTRIINNPRCGKCSMNETSDILSDSISNKIDFFKPIKFSSILFEASNNIHKKKVDPSNCN